MLTPARRLPVVWHRCQGDAAEPAGKSGREFCPRWAGNPVTADPIGQGSVKQTESREMYTSGFAAGDPEGVLVPGALGFPFSVM